jgi:hypothetical protein
LPPSIKFLLIEIDVHGITPSQAEQAVSKIRLIIP